MRDTDPPTYGASIYIYIFMHIHTVVLVCFYLYIYICIRFRSCLFLKQESIGIDLVHLVVKSQGLGC